MYKSVITMNRRHAKRTVFASASLMLILAQQGAAQEAGLVNTVFIILMENHDWSQIKDNPLAPYINDTLLPMSSYAEQYYNPPGIHPSLPNYLWLEAGDNFGIRDDGLPAVNHQSTTSHLVTLLENAGLTWKSYQEDITGEVCPLSNFMRYAPKHNPMVYFDDVTDTNDPNSQHCIDHVRPYTELETDLANDTVANYNFIAPNLCNDMHDSCPPINNSIRQGDLWLSTEVPNILIPRGTGTAARSSLPGTRDGAAATARSGSSCSHPSRRATATRTRSITRTARRCERSRPSFA